jgi:hypothetical protein
MLDLTSQDSSLFVCFMWSWHLYCITPHTQHTVVQRGNTAIEWCGRSDRICARMNSTCHTKVLSLKVGCGLTI